MAPIFVAAVAVATAQAGLLYVDVHPRIDGTGPSVAAGAIARALTDAGLSAVASPEPPRNCGGRCVKVAIHDLGAESFSIEVRSGAQVARTVARLPEGAGEFDRAHALGVQIEMLVERVASVPTVAHPRSRPPVSRPPPEERVAETAPATISPATPIPPVQPSSPPVPVPVAHDVAAPSVASRPARLALEVAATFVSGLSGSLVTEGVTVGLRLPISELLDVRARTALLRPARGKDHGVRYDRDLLPLDLLLTTAVLPLTRLRAGVGVAAAHVTDDDAGAGSVWLLGPSATAEYRLPFPSFSVTGGLQVSWLPRAWRVTRAPDAHFEFPVWTLAASLGLEFRVF